MDPAQGETQGKSLTSKFKAKVKGVKSKVHMPGHKKKQDGAQGNNDSSPDYSSDDSSPRKPGPEMGYNLGESTPYTTVKNTPLSPQRSPPHETHDREFAPPAATRSSEQRRPSDHSFQTGEQNYETSKLTEGNANPSSPNPTNPSPGVLGQVKNTVGSAAAAVGSKVGYYPEAEDTPHGSDPSAPTLVEKTKATLGLDKPSDPSAPSLVEKTKATLGFAKPGTDPAGSPQQPGVVDRVSGAVSSFFTSSPKEVGDLKDEQATFPAHSDYKPQPGDGGVEDARVPKTSTPPAYN